MRLNKSSIEWCDYTANPVRGKCFHGCSYCYVTAQRKRFKTSGKITFHPEVLEVIGNHKKPATIFVGSSHDLFGGWISPERIGRILTACAMASQHEYVFLTKNPERYNYFYKMDNNAPPVKFMRYFGASIDTIVRAESTMPFMDRLDFLSIEPLLENVAHHIPWGKVRAIIIGTQTGSGAFKPPIEWIEAILDCADSTSTKIFIKDNLFKLYPNLPRRRELLWPLFTKDAK